MEITLIYLKLSLRQTVKLPQKTSLNMSILFLKEFYKRIQNLALKQNEPEETRLVCVTEDWLAMRGTDERRLPGETFPLIS